MRLLEPLGGRLAGHEISVHRYRLVPVVDEFWNLDEFGLILRGKLLNILAMARPYEKNRLLNRCGMNIEHIFLRNGISNSHKGIKRPSCIKIADDLWISRD
jgi:hypothetical protein